MFGCKNINLDITIVYSEFNLTILYCTMGANKGFMRIFYYSIGVKK